MLEVRMKPPPPAPPHVAALSYFWGRWGSEEPGLKTTNPSFLALCVCTLPLFPGPALPQGEEIISQKNRPEYFPRAPVTLPLFSHTLGGRGRAGPAGTEGADARRAGRKTHRFYLSCRGWFPSQLSRQGWGRASSTW